VHPDENLNGADVMRYVANAASDLVSVIRAMKEVTRIPVG